MSASIFWEPLKPANPKRIRTGCPSEFLRHLEQIFGERSPNLHHSDLPALKTLAAIQDDEDTRKDLGKIIKHIEGGGSVSIDYSH